jgi:Na+/melibiose symporter-like transporter
LADSAPRLPLRVQLGYATAESGINTVETILRLYLLAFYTDQVALSASLAGLAAALAIVWDAVTDPIMGVISDRTRHRFGGRRGYLPAGGVLLALGVLAVFWPPAMDGQAAKFGWLLLSYCFLNTGMTVLSVPYMAMAGEMTANPHERTVLFGARFACSNLGAFVAAALPVLLALPQAAIAAAILVVGTAMASWVATANVRFVHVPLQPVSMARAFAAPFGNRTFLPLLLAYVIANLGIGVNAAAFLYYYRHVLVFSDGDRQTVLATFLGMFTLSILVWVTLAKRFGKRRPLILGALVLGVGTAILYFWPPVGDFWRVMWVGAIGLGTFVGSIVLIDTMLTDVLDHDLLRTGELRSGLFFGVWRFASKLARALSVALVGALLDVAGFVEGAEQQPESVRQALIWLFGPGVGAFFGAAAVVLWRYRFTDARQAQVRRLLARRTERANAAAPAGSA